MSLGGWVADSALSLVVGGQGSREDNRLIDTCEQALIAGIEAAQAGNRLGDISAAIGAESKAAGYLVNTDFGGHGVGRTMHEDPSIPNDGTQDRAGAQTGHGVCDRAVADAQHRRDLHRGGWLDTDERRWFALGPRRTHRRHHEEWSARLDRTELVV